MLYEWIPQKHIHKPTIQLTGARIRGLSQCVGHSCEHFLFFYSAVASPSWTSWWTWPVKRRQQTLAKFDASHLYPSNADSAASAVMYIEKFCKSSRRSAGTVQGLGIQWMCLKSKSFDMLWQAFLRVSKSVDWTFSALPFARRSGLKVMFRCHRSLKALKCRCFRDGRDSVKKIE